MNITKLQHHEAVKMANEANARYSQEWHWYFDRYLVRDDWKYAEKKEAKERMMRKEESLRRLLKALDVRPWELDFVEYGL